MFPVFLNNIAMTLAAAVSMTGAATGSGASALKPAQTVPTLPFSVSLAPGDTYTPSGGSAVTNSGSGYMPESMNAGDTIASGTGAIRTVIITNDTHEVEVLTSTTVMAMAANQTDYCPNAFLQLITGNITIESVSSPNPAAKIIIQTHHIGTLSIGCTIGISYVPATSHTVTVTDNAGQVEFQFVDGTGPSTTGAFNPVQTIQLSDSGPLPAPPPGVVEIVYEKFVVKGRAMPTRHRHRPADRHHPRHG